MSAAASPAASSPAAAPGGSGGRPGSGAPRGRLRGPGRALVYVGGVGLAAAAAWAVALAWVFPADPSLLGLGLLAFSLGLRHAFDADHIAAIDNTARKLIQEGRSQPLGVGLFFSLGHSTVVALMVLATAISTRAVTARMPALRHVGDLLGTAVSGGFLYLIGLINLAVLLDLARAFRQASRGEIDAGRLEHLLASRGLMSRLLGPLFRVIRREWQMYPVGFLFGLGFDTASEVMLLALAGGAATRHLPLAAILALPLLFAAGMTLMDTADGAFMCAAYGWAFADPLRKVYYNLTLTGLSVFVALSVGSVELAQVATERLRLAGGAWDLLKRLDFGTLGYAVVSLFLVTWALSLAVWKLRFEGRRGAVSPGASRRSP